MVNKKHHELKVKDEKTILFGEKPVNVFSFRNPEEIPWRAAGADFVVSPLESSQLTTKLEEICSKANADPTRDLPHGWIDKCLDFCDYFLTGIAEYQKLITRNPIFLERVEGVGIIGGEEAINWGLSGPMLRASGLLLMQVPVTIFNVYGCNSLRCRELGIRIVAYSPLGRGLFSLGYWRSSIYQEMLSHAEKYSDITNKRADFSHGVWYCGLFSGNGFAKTQSKMLLGNLLAAFGHGAPEFESGIYTEMSDVYSFGVLMLELLTGRKSYDRRRFFFSI